MYLRLKSQFRVLAATTFALLTTILVEIAAHHRQAEKHKRLNLLRLADYASALTRSTDTLLKRKNKKRLIIDLDSTEDPAHGKQEGVA